jgi:hypothetical protein
MKHLATKIPEEPKELGVTPTKITPRFEIPKFKSPGE